MANKIGVYLAPQDKVKQYEPQIIALLNMLGHPEALVTDESSFLDFLSPFEYGTREDAQRELDRLLLEAGVDVAVLVDGYLVEAAAYIHSHYPHWPDKEPLQ